MALTQTMSRFIVSKPQLFLRSCSVSRQERDVIGCREVVGFGHNGQRIYVDRQDFPFPAIRFMAENRYLQALKEKEKCDWKLLSIDEKKCLYRSSFCQTFSEMDAPTGEWKSIVGGTCVCVSLALWFFLFLKMFVYPKELPLSFSPEAMQAQLKQKIDMAFDPIEGLASKWDYENNCWKK